MSKAKVYADLVCGIPYGNAGAKRWQKVGVMLEVEDNNAVKGPGYIVMLDRWFNPAGVPITGGDPNSLLLSVYWPKEAKDD